MVWMLDHRVYRAAFLPALVVLVVAAFALGGRPPAETTPVSPDQFDVSRTLGAVRAPLPGSLLGMAEAYPDRRPGSPGDMALANFMERAIVQSGFARSEAVRRIDVEGETVDGRRDLRLVLAERQGLSSRRVLILAHRDSLARPGTAELSGTAMLLELARVLADRDLQLTVVLASVSGGTGGFAGAREAVRRVGGPLDSVIVLGDLASRQPRRPWVVPWSVSGAPAPHALRRTVETALRAEGAEPGGVRASAQWARRAFPVAVSEQGVINGAGPPAVLVSASGEIGPRPGARVSRERLQTFGRGVLRAFTALEGSQPESGSQPGLSARHDRGGIITFKRLLPDWSVRLIVLTLLLPALLGAVDAFFRVRRRRLPVGRWLAWAASWGLPFVLAWLWLRALDAVRLVDALSAPAPPGAAGLSTGPLLAIGSAVLVIVLGFFARRRLLERVGPVGTPAAGGAAAAVALLIAVLAALVWLANPYAAVVLVAAAHAWLLVPAPESRLRGVPAAAAALAGLLPAGLIGLYYLVTLDLSATEALRLGFDLTAGGQVSLLDALVLALFAGLAIAVATILRGRGHAIAQAPPERIRTRGPVSYAGPGSLGGTESALRQ
jgi:hypothetical protein